LTVHIQKEAKGAHIQENNTQKISVPDAYIDSHLHALTKQQRPKTKP